MSTGHDHEHVITPVRTYVFTFLSLLIFTALTVYVARQDFGEMNTIVALAIAATKATLVVVFFMGVRYNTPLTKVVVVAGFFWLFILFGLGLSDYFTRSYAAMHIAVGR